MQMWRVEVPVIEQMDHRTGTVWEHTPLDFTRGEYPRFHRPVGAHRPRSRSVYIRAETLADAIKRAKEK